jgi:hypothetical protein
MQHPISILFVLYSVRFITVVDSVPSAHPERLNVRATRTKVRGISRADVDVVRRPRRRVERPALFARVPGHNHPGPARTIR